MPDVNKIDFPPPFRQELSDKLNIREQDVIDTIKDADYEETISVADLHLRFFEKYIPQRPHPYYILTYGGQTDSIQKVDMAWKFPPEFYGSTESRSPLFLLGAFAQKFGLEIRIGDITRKFYYNRMITIPRANQQNPIEILNPEHHEYVQQLYTKQTEKDGRILIHCALGMCINMDQYRTEMITE